MPCGAVTTCDAAVDGRVPGSEMSAFMTLTAFASGSAREMEDRSVRAGTAPLSPSNDFARGFDAVCVPPALEIPEETIDREPSEAFRVVFCGTRLGTRRKGLRFLLEALELARHRPLEVTVIGEPDSGFDEAVGRVEESGVGVTLLGRVPRDRYLGLLARETDALVFPSLYEEWGYTLFEALVRGVPAIAFDLYPFSEILDSRTGVLVPPRDVEALAAAIDDAAAGGLPGAGEVKGATREQFGSALVAERLQDAWS